MFRQKDQNKSLLDKLTQEKLDSKSKFGKKRNDLSSGRDSALKETPCLLSSSAIVHFKPLFNSSVRFSLPLISLHYFCAATLALINHLILHFCHGHIHF